MWGCWAEPPHGRLASHPGIYLRPGRRQSLGRQTFHPRAALGGPEARALFLAQTAADFPDEYCLMRRDGAGWHPAPALPIPPRRRLISWPPYSPQLNPVAPRGEHRRENYFGHRVWPSLAAVTDRLCQGLRHLDQQPEQVKSLSCFDWVKTLSLTVK